MVVFFFFISALRFLRSWHSLCLVVVLRSLLFKVLSFSIVFFLFDKRFKHNRQEKRNVLGGIACQ